MEFIWGLLGILCSIIIYFIFRLLKNKYIFQLKKEEFNIPGDFDTVYYKRGYAAIEHTKLFVWKSDNNLCFFPAVPMNNADKYILFKLPIQDIEYFYSKGEVSSETQITGGEVTEEVSIGGAVVGGALFGPIGALIGSRTGRGRTPTKSEVVTYDNRETYLNYTIDNASHSLFFRSKDYQTLLRLIPEKEFKNINS